MLSELTVHICAIYISVFAVKMVPFLLKTYYFTVRLLLSLGLILAVTQQPNPGLGPSLLMLLDHIQLGAHTHTHIHTHTHPVGLY